MSLLCLLSLTSSSHAVCEQVMEGLIEQLRMSNKLRESRNMLAKVTQHISIRNRAI